MVSSAFSVSLASISRAAKEHQWKTRCAAFLESKAIRDAETERQQRHDDHIKKLEAYRSKNENLGGALGMAAAKLLQHADKTMNEMRDAGETLDRRLLGTALQTAAKLADMSRTLSGSSLGVDALLSGFSEDGDDEAYS
jgi:hypothetical protein